YVCSRRCMARYRSKHSTPLWLSCQYKNDCCPGLVPSCDYGSLPHCHNATERRHFLLLVGEPSGMQPTRGTRQPQKLTAGSPRLMRRDQRSTSTPCLQYLLFQVVFSIFST